VSNEGKKARKIVDWNFNPTEYSPVSGSISVKGNVRYDDGSVEPKNKDFSL
jgi:hypothetical protein